MDLHKVMKQFDHLSKDQFVEALLKAGIITGTQLEAAPKMIELREQLETREMLRKRIEDAERCISEIDTILATLCPHTDQDVKVSDDHDGWTRGEYTQYTRRTCKLCGHVSSEQKTCTH